MIDQRLSRARYTAEDAVNALGNRYCLVLAVANRARELKRGAASKVLSDAKPIVNALQEVEAGLIGLEYVVKGIRV